MFLAFQIGTASLKLYKQFKFNNLSAQEQNLIIFSNVCSTVSKNYYDQSFNSKNWNRICNDAIPAVKNARNKEEFESIINQKLQEIGIYNDPYPSSGIDSPDFYPNSVKNENAIYATGIEYSFNNIKKLPYDVAVITNVQPNSNAARAGIKPGWMINLDTSLKEKNGIEYSGGYIIPVDYNDYINANTTNKEKLLQTPAIKVKLQTIHFANSTELPTKELANKILYVHLADIGDRSKFKKIQLLLHINKYKGIIFDFRQNFSYNTTSNLPRINKILGYIFPSKKLAYITTSAKGNKPILVNSLYHFDGKICVITDSMTNHEGEVFVAAIKSNGRGKIIGGTTNGSVLDTDYFFMQGNYIQEIPIVSYLDANKQPIEGVGVTPDIIVHPTIEGISQGRDEILERAIQEISKN